MRQLFFELSEMKDKKYPNKVWIDLVRYRDNIWLEGEWGQKRMLSYYRKRIFDQSERALPYIEINWYLLLIFHT